MRFTPKKINHNILDVRKIYVKSGVGMTFANPVHQYDGVYVGYGNLGEVFITGSKLMQYPRDFFKPNEYESLLCIAMEQFIEDAEIIE